MQKKKKKKVLKPPQSRLSFSILFYYWTHTSHPAQPCMIPTSLVLPQSPTPPPTSSSSISIKSTTGRLCAHQPGVTSPMMGVVRGSHLGEAVLGEHVKKGCLPALAVPHHHYLTLHTLAGIHAGFQRQFLTGASLLH